MLQRIWLGFFLLGLLFALQKLFFLNDLSVFTQLSDSLFDAAKKSFEIGLGLIGIMALWLGLLQVAQDAGLVTWLSRKISPVFSVLFPGIPENHPAQGAIMLNLSANMLGLDNAATPLGLKAMEELQTLNTDKETASDAQILFLLLNASGLTIVPISIIAFRAKAGAVSPSDVFIPILLATFASTVTVLLLAAIRQRLPIWKPRFSVPFLLICSAIVAAVLGLMRMEAADIQSISSLVGNGILVLLVVGILVAGQRKGIQIFNTFIDGAKEGFQMGVNVIPFLVAMLCAIAFFRASGGLDFFLSGITWAVESLGWNADFVPAIPTMLMKPLSGSGSRGLMIETMDKLGADAFAARLSCVAQGAADTTFYIMTVYCGAVKIKNIRYALGYSLWGDLAGFLTAIFVAYLFFHP